MLELTLIKLNTYTEMHLEKKIPLSYSLGEKRYFFTFLIQHETSATEW